LINLGISAIGLVSVGTAVGSIERSLSPARLNFPEFKLLVDLSSVIGVDLEGEAVQGIPLVALIGRDILRHRQFIYDGSGGFITLSY